MANVQQRDKKMKPKISWLLLAILLLATVPFAEAQEGKKILWIGYLAGSGSAPNQAFVQGMQDLGYVEGKNIALSIGLRRVDESGTRISQPRWSA
jgi:hypothetical protein